MPIRLSDDPQDQNQNDYNDDPGGAGNRRGGRRRSFLFFTSDIRIAINRNQLSDNQ